jgi:hypothetical protein
MALPWLNAVRMVDEIKAKLGSVEAMNVQVELAHCVGLFVVGRITVSPLSVGMKDSTSEGVVHPGVACAVAPVEAPAAKRHRPTFRNVIGISDHFKFSRDHAGNAGRIAQGASASNEIHSMRGSDPHPLVTPGVYETVTRSLLARAVIVTARISLLSAGIRNHISAPVSDRRSFTVLHDETTWPWVITTCPVTSSALA